MSRSDSFYTDARADFPPPTISFGLPNSPENSSNTIWHDCQDDPFVIISRSTTSMPALSALVEQAMEERHKAAGFDVERQSPLQLQWTSPRETAWQRFSRSLRTIFDFIANSIASFLALFSSRPSTDSPKVFRRSSAPSPSPSKHVHASRLNSPLCEPEFVCSDHPFFEIRSYKAPLLEGDGFVEYQTWHDESRDSCGADILFIPDNMSYFVSVPDAVHGYLQAGYRLISVDFHSNTRQSPPSDKVEHMAAMMDAVLRNVSQREAFNRATRPPSAISLGSPRPRNTSASISAALATETKVSTTYGQPVRSAIKHRPIFLLGIGQGALVATKFALSQIPYASHDLRFNSPLQQVFGKFRPAKLHRTWNSIGLVANRPIAGLILISPHVESSKSLAGPTKRGKKGRRVSAQNPIQHLGTPIATPPSLASRKSVDHLLSHVHALRTPCLIMHGTRDPCTSAAAVTQFYEKLGSRDKCLSLYPGQGNLSAGDRHDSASTLVEALEWLDEHWRAAPSPALTSRVRFDDSVGAISPVASPKMISDGANPADLEVPRIRVSHDCDFSLVLCVKY